MALALCCQGCHGDPESFKESIVENGTRLHISVLTPSQVQNWECHCSPTCPLGVAIQGSNDGSRQWLEFPGNICGSKSQQVILKAQLEMVGGQGTEQPLGLRTLESLKCQQFFWSPVQSMETWSPYWGSWASLDPESKMNLD